MTDRNDNASPAEPPPPPFWLDSFGASMAHNDEIRSSILQDIVQIESQMKEKQEQYEQEQRIERQLQQDWSHVEKELGECLQTAQDMKAWTQMHGECVQKYLEQQQKEEEQDKKGESTPHVVTPPRDRASLPSVQAVQARVHEAKKAMQTAREIKLRVQQQQKVLQELETRSKELDRAIQTAESQLQAKKDETDASLAKAAEAKAKHEAMKEEMDRFTEESRQKEQELMEEIARVEKWNAETQPPEDGHEENMWTLLSTYYDRLKEWVECAVRLQHLEADELIKIEEHAARERHLDGQIEEVRANIAALKQQLEDSAAQAEIDCLREKNRVFEEEELMPLRQQENDLIAELAAEFTDDPKIKNDLPKTLQGWMTMLVNEIRELGDHHERMMRPLLPPEGGEEEKDVPDLIQGYRNALQKQQTEDKALTEAKKKKAETLKQIEAFEQEKDAFNQEKQEEINALEQEVEKLRKTKADRDEQLSMHKKKEEMKVKLVDAQAEHDKTVEYATFIRRANRAGRKLLADTARKEKEILSYESGKSKGHRASK